MRNVCFLLLLFTIGNSCGVLFPAQRPRCERLVASDSLKQELQLTESSPRAYVVQRKLLPPLQKRHLRSREQLGLIATRICNERKIFMDDSLWGRNFQLSLTKGEVPFSPQLFVDSIGTITVENELKSAAPYGFNALDGKASYIALASLRVDDREIAVPAEAVRDLLFPNFCETILPIRPIELYYDPEGQALYLYVFGAYRPNEFVDYQAAFRQSYLAKLVFDLETGYVGRIVLRGHELAYYNWANCPEFVGF